MEKHQDDMSRFDTVDQAANPSFFTRFQTTPFSR